MEMDTINTDAETDDSSDENSEGYWEEVLCDFDQPPSIPPEGLRITVPIDGYVKPKSRKKDDVESLLRRDYNRCRKEYQEDLHKVSLLCFLSTGYLFNGILRSETVLAAALSTLPSKQSYPPKHMDLSYLEKFIKWFTKRFTLEVNSEDTNSLMIPNLMEEQLISQLGTAIALNHNYLVCLFIVILRSLGVEARFVWSLTPISLKPQSVDLLKDPNNKINKLLKAESSKGKKANKKQTKPVKENVVPSSPNNTSSKKGANGNIVNGKKKTKVPEYLNSDDSDFETPPKKRKRKATTEENCKRSKTKSQKAKAHSSTKENQPQPALKEVFHEPSKKAKLWYNIWAEVYLEEEEQWISVDLTTGSVLCDSKIEGKATQPVTYVLSFDNQGSVKDVTRRYSSQWLTGAQKRRVDSGWWIESIKPFHTSRSARDNEEDEALDQRLLNQPIPTSIQELKGHPLYCLRRHLLKFEAVYPPEPNPVGFIKNEAVYFRERVKILHTKELWMRKAKVVRIGETAYKIVKSRPKYDKRSGQVIKDLPLELFGEWQVDDFIPPIAVDGKVPRNDYGNVELFLDKMLPMGTVHLQVPGLNRVARKLDIDCARALVGFEYHSGGCHPTYDGFVVCEEFKDVLIDAWNQEQDEIQKREMEKRKKTIYQRWGRLVKLVLIRQRLQLAAQGDEIPEHSKITKSSAKRVKS